MHTRLVSDYPDRCIKHWHKASVPSVPQGAALRKTTSFYSSSMLHVLLCFRARSAADKNYRMTWRGWWIHVYCRGVTVSRAYLFRIILKAFGNLQLTWMESQSLESLLVLRALLWQWVYYGCTVCCVSSVLLQAGILSQDAWAVLSCDCLFDLKLDLIQGTMRVCVPMYVYVCKTARRRQS